MRPVPVLLSACLALATGHTLAFQPSPEELEKAKEDAKAAAPENTKPSEPAKPAPAPDVKGTMQAPNASGVKPSAPAADNEATRILHESAETIRRARLITYSFRQSATGGMAEVTQDITADMRMTRRTPPGAQPTPGDPWYARVVGEGGSTRRRTAFEVVFFREPSLPEQAEWLDNEAKKLSQRAINSPGPGLMLAKTTRLDPLFADQPFSKELSGSTAELTGRETIDGVECDVITLTKGANNTERWYIATSDRIPRQHVKVSNAGQFSGEIVRTLSGVNVDDIDQGSSAAEALRLKLPEGFTEDRAAIPRPVPPANTAPTPNSSPGATAPKPDAAAPPRPSLPATAPEFEIARHGSADDRVTRESLRGNVAVLEFYGSWNVSLDAWHPHLETLAREFAPKGAKFLAASVRERSKDAGAEMLKNANAPFDALVEGDAAAGAFAISVFPAVAVIGKEGELLALVQGCRGESSKFDVQNAIERGLGLPITPRPTPAPSADAQAADSAMLPEAKPGDAQKPDGKKPEPKKPDAKPATPTAPTITKAPPTAPTATPEKKPGAAPTTLSPPHGGLAPMGTPNKDGTRPRNEKPGGGMKPGGKPTKPS